MVGMKRVETWRAGNLSSKAEESGQVAGPPVEITNVGFCVEKECIEVLLVNNLAEDIDSAKILVANVDGTTEKHFFEQDVELWSPCEEIMLKFPLLQNIREYVISIEGEWGQKLLNKKIDVSKILHIVLVGD